jgi:hypothetical protein
VAKVIERFHTRRDVLIFLHLISVSRVPLLPEDDGPGCAEETFEQKVDEEVLGESLVTTPFELRVINLFARLRKLQPSDDKNFNPMMEEHSVGFIFLHDYLNKNVGQVFGLR